MQYFSETIAREVLGQKEEVVFFTGYQRDVVWWVGNANVRS